MDKNQKLSYEGSMMKNHNMPKREEVEEQLLITLFKRNGVLKEFASGEIIVDEIADVFNLKTKQRNAYLKTVYRKENRPKRSLLWHRLLFRAADSLAKQSFVTRPSKTFKLTNSKEWMLTEKGYDKVLVLLNIPESNKSILPIKSYELQKMVKKLKNSNHPKNYIPISKKKKTVILTKEMCLRSRGFRQAIIEVYDLKCAVCGLKICSPDSRSWEVEAAHIVPHREMGKDDIWNGLALCRLHHWAFDNGWFTLKDNYKIQVSSKAYALDSGYGRMGEFKIFNELIKSSQSIYLPADVNAYPHVNSLKWHQQNVFYK